MGRVEPMILRAGERGIVRVFALNMPPEQARFLREPGAVDEHLGTSPVDVAHVDIFPVSDLEELGLAGYLVEGCGIPEDELIADRDRLNAVTGWVLIVRSRAFGGRAVTLAPGPGLSLLGAWSEAPTDWSGGPIETTSARPGSAPRQSPRTARAQSRRIGGTIFFVFMAILLALIALLVT